MEKFNKFVEYNITDLLIVTDLLLIYEYYYYFLNIFTDSSWVCSVGTCIVGISF